MPKDRKVKKVNKTVCKNIKSKFVYLLSDNYVCITIKTDKTMKDERKVNISIILSTITLILTIGIIIIWCVCVKEFSVITENTFIGTCISLISLALPIIIGYQIINSLDIKHSLKESEEKIEKYKKKINDSIESSKKEFDKEIEKIQEINRNLYKSLEVEKKERELLFQDIKVAMYHGKTINNAALALFEQIDAIKLIIELERTEELKENFRLLFFIIKQIHQNDFTSIKSELYNKIVGLSSKGVFEDVQFEKEIKKKLRKLPQIDDKYEECIIEVVKALDCKMSFLKKGSIGNAEAIDAQIEEYLKQVDEIL